jgi:tetratricopeptide (TPR) repeat protein
LIVRNEERHLARCLASVKPVAWQMIVVDTGSNDRTVDIAREFGAEVHHYAWCDDFSAARNEALSHARGDWVLSLDADEELPAESLAELSRHMRTAEAMAFRLPLVESGKAEEGCHYVPRLFRNAPGVCFYGRIHEHPFAAIESLCAAWGLENRLGKARILHYGYSDGSVCQKDKAARNLRLLQLAVEEDPEDLNLQMNFGLELARAGRLPDALPYYRAAFDGLGALPVERVAPELRETLLTQYATHLLAAGSPEEAVQVLQSPLGEQGLSASQQFALGFSLMSLNRLEEAIAAFHACLNTSRVPALGPVNPEIYRGAPEHCMAICFWKLGRMDEAQRTFAEAAGAHVEARTLRMDWARCLTATGDSIRALGLVHELVKRDASDIEIWRLGGEIALTTTETFDFAADWTGEAVKLHPGDPVLSWQRAEAQLLTGDAAGAAVTLGALADPGARVRGVRTLCECLQGARPGVEPSLEPELSGALLEWYRTLVDRGASGLVNRINESMALWGVALPTAARILGQAIEEAATE